MCFNEEGLALMKNRHLKGTNEKKKKTEMENTQNRALKYKVQGTK